ncbi:MAG: amino acid ABC transporter permease [Hyphomicrobiales bacterium]|nr:amino acid ABC transporter permease [Hyphomicrobiales bacterium]MDE2018093.1 amino acid ABC transporter permease [Hyphomicrobiales bacterium]
MVEFTAWDILRNLALAARWTLALSLLAFIGGSLAGAVAAFGRLSASRVARAAAGAYVDLFQGTPLLVQLFLCYFGLPLVGVETSAWTSAALALTLYSGAFLAEIWRGCVEAVSRDQSEAARSLALSPIQGFVHVILPQAARLGVAPTVGFLVQVIKGTALASVVGFVELTRAGGMIANATLRPLPVYAAVGAFYFAICWPISAAARNLEVRLNAGRD